MTDFPEWAWIGRGRMSADGPWHVLKRLPLDGGEPETFCGATVYKIRRDRPKVRPCRKCIALATRNP
jgi:hypothetical protein